MIDADSGVSGPDADDGSVDQGLENEFERDSDIHGPPDRMAPLDCRTDCRNRSMEMIANCMADGGTEAACE